MKHALSIQQFSQRYLRAAIGLAALAVWLVPACHGQLQSETANADRPNLHQIAELLETDLVERFLLEGQVPPKRRPPSDAVPYVSYNMPDNAYMTGMYLANQTYRWRADRDPKARELAREACRALHTLLAVTGKPGLFARSFMPWEMPYQDDGEWHKSADGRYRWRDDVSSDQVDGYMYGCRCTTAASAQRLANGARPRDVTQHTIASRDLTP